MIPGKSDQLDEILADVKQIIEEMVIPLEGEFFSSGASFDSLVSQLEEVRQEVKNRGLWVPFMPEAYGGKDLSLVDFAYLSEAMGRSPLGHYVFNCQAPDIGNMELLLKFGSPPQKEQYLVPLVNGEIRSCFSMTEPDYPGSNPTWMVTRAVKAGDDYVINGRKWFTSAADGASFAVVMAVTNPENESRHQRASMIIVPTDTPGFRLVRNTPVMGEPGSGYGSHGEIDYVDCRVPQTNRLGLEGDGFVLAQERLGPGRIHHCMRWIGICERAFDLMCRRAVRRQITPGMPLGTLGMVHAMIADSRAEIDAARLMVLATAAKIDLDGPKAARDEISTIKFFVANTLQRVLDRAIQVHGGLGVTDYTPLAFWYRHERAARIYDGPDEVHKFSVARRILRQYAAQVPEK